MEKSWNVVSVIRIFFNIRKKMQNLFFVTCVSFYTLIFDYWWLHMAKSFDVKTIFWQITHAAKTRLSTNFISWKNNLLSWKNHGILFSVSSGNPPG